MKTTDGIYDVALLNIVLLFAHKMIFTATAIKTALVKMFM